MRALSLTLATVSALAAATAAQAGGFTPPAVEIEPAAPVVIETAPAGNWAGGYAGASLGYSFGGDDNIGIDTYQDGALIDRALNLGSVDLKGLTGGLHAGYRWQRDNWVFGPELWVEAGSVEASDDVSYSYLNPVLGFQDVEVEAASKVNYLAGLQMKTGYAVNPQSLVYGTAGIVRGDFSYDDVDYSETGYSVGLGVERKLRDNLSIMAEYQYRHFGSVEVGVDYADGESIRTVATPSHHNLKVGVNFSF